MKSGFFFEVFSFLSFLFACFSTSLRTKKKRQLSLSQSINLRSLAVCCLVNKNKKRNQIQVWKKWGVLKVKSTKRKKEKTKKS